MYTLNLNGHLWELDSPKVMGILNITPDSFYDGGKYNESSALLNRVERMLEEGVDIVDIGGYSSRPGADDISEEEEIVRVKTAIQLIKKEFVDIIVSVDTFRSKVANIAVSEGALMVNDISAGTLDSKMLDVVSSLDVPYIMMHMRGTPQNMSLNTVYDNLCLEVIDFLQKQKAKAIKKGIKDIIIDPGFGFAKTMEQNYDLMQSLSLLKVLDSPILVGVSRKSMIYRYLDITSEEALNGTSVLNFYALQNGATILRVHDVKEAVECLKLYSRLEK